MCEISLSQSSRHYLIFFTPRRACAAKGLSDCSWTGLYNYIYRNFFQNSKNTHFQKSISTQEGFSSNSMASSTTYELGKSSWPSQILLVCRLGTGSASSETQTLTRSKPHPYCIAIRLNSLALPTLYPKSRVSRVWSH